MSRFINEFKDSPNKWYFILKYSKVFVAIFVVIGGIFGLIGHYKLNKEVFDLSVLNDTVALFLMQWGDKSNEYLDIAKLFALLSILFGAMAYYFYRFGNSVRIKKVQKSPYTLVVGLGEQNRNFLQNASDKNTLTIELDKNNKNIERFRKKGFAIMQGDAKDEIKNLNLTNLQNCLISTANDRVNSAIALELMNNLSSGKKIFVNLANSDIAILFKQNILTKKNSADVLPYTLQDILIKELFAKHHIVGNFKELIQSGEEYNIVIVGDSLLALRLIYNIAIVANLPKENRLNLYLVNKEPQEFANRVKKQFSAIRQIRDLNLIPYKLDSASLEFYQDKLWQKKNLTNIYLCYEEEDKNLDIAINLQDTTFVQACATKSLRSKIFIAIYNDLGLSRKITRNNELFKNFYTFANFQEAITWENIIDERLDLVAKLINNAYSGTKAINKDELEQKWLKLDIFKRESNRAQAMHIDTKLLALGLQKVTSPRGLEERLAINTIAFKKALAKALGEEVDIDNPNWYKFPKRFDTIISQLARAEHNRWNAFHYLHGWSYSPTRDDKAKKHNCLLPLEKFGPKEQATYQYDVQSVLNIPVYLAHAGYEIVEINS